MAEASIMMVVGDYDDPFLPVEIFGVMFDVDAGSIVHWRWLHSEPGSHECVVFGLAPLLDLPCS